MCIRDRYLAHTTPLFRTLNILGIFNINSFFIACFMYSYHNNLLCKTFNTIFDTHRQVHTYNPRNANSTDHISVEPTLNSSQSFTWDLNYETPFPIILRSWQGTGSRFKTSLKKISYRESYKLNSTYHDMAPYTKSELNMRSPYFYKLYTSTCGLPRHFVCYKS